MPISDVKSSGLSGECDVGPQLKPADVVKPAWYKLLGEDMFKSQICNPLLQKASWVKPMKSMFGQGANEGARSAGLDCACHFAFCQLETPPIGRDR